MDVNGTYCLRGNGSFNRCQYMSRGFHLCVQMSLVKNNEQNVRNY